MDRITFRINGEEHSVGGEVRSDTTLLDYVRQSAELRGAKYMCREGGCGACALSVALPSPAPAGAPAAQAVCSCMVSVTSCQGWDVTTVERLSRGGAGGGGGARVAGYHPLQRALAQHHGSQCGYCSPGWIMAMYSLLQSEKSLTMLDIEKSFGSNVCRCTGYRPILDAFKIFAVDSPTPSEIPDIEEVYVCNKTGKSCTRKTNCDEDEWCFVSHDELEQSRAIEIDLKDDRKWFRVTSVAEVLALLRAHAGHDAAGQSYMLVAGNTAKGAYPIVEYPRILIDISAVGELKGYLVDQNLAVGAGCTLTETLHIFRRMADVQYFEYLKKFYDHLSLVAHIAIRNLGTLAGNLMIKHEHNEFPSDVFLLLETVGARLTIQNVFGVTESVTMIEFLKTDMRGRIILNAVLPPLNSKYNVVTYKVMPRAQNAHAIVNAGFLYKLDGQRNRVTECRIVFGGLAPAAVRGAATESRLLGKELFTNETLQLAIDSLKSELIATENPPEFSAAYRKQLAINLFYKGLVELCPARALAPALRSGEVRVREARALSRGQQTFDSDPSLWPLNQPVPKLEALIQCSGEAAYTEDIPALPREVFAAFVLSTVPRGRIVAVDHTPATNEHGVIAFYSAKDIPGINSFLTVDVAGKTVEEELLSSGEIKFYNQPIGIVVADTRQAAERAAGLVRVTYTDVRTPVIDIKRAKADPARSTLYFSSTATSAGSDVKKVIKGDYTIYGQYHFPMETLVCVSRPTEQGVEVHAATQWLDMVQLVISRALNIDQNRVDVYVTRLGGAYGLKVSRGAQAAAGCALAARALGRPCRFIQPLTTNMRAAGKRFPCSNNFEVGVNGSGVIQYLKQDLYSDNGHLVNELVVQVGVRVYSNCYDSAAWSYRCYNTVTDNPKNTWCRAPGTLENISMVEMLMERISYELSLDPLQVRLANLDTKYRKDIIEMVATLTTDSDYRKRRLIVDKFNAENRWKKRGLRFSLMRWTLADTTYLDITLSVYHGDGSVAITHGGVEMGQGINTKAAQICAYFLNIPLNKIQIKRNDTMIAPNSYTSAGSFTSQYVGLGVERACGELLARLKPIRERMVSPTWEQLVAEAFEAGVDLQAHGFVNKDDLRPYDIFGVGLAEVEVDVLTGEYNILRVDLLQDAGRSVSPEIDIGQVEGAFVMGQGYWTSERLAHAPATGELLTDRTWHYYVPQARDIPQEFRIYFRKKSNGEQIFLGAKATGEPPLCLSVCVPLALRDAFTAARVHAGLPPTSWCQLGQYTTHSLAHSLTPPLCLSVCLPPALRDAFTAARAHPGRPAAHELVPAGWPVHCGKCLLGDSNENTRF